MPKFSKINIEISNICNLQCSFCPEVIRDKKRMEPALFRRIIQQVASLTDQVCLHLMGDPLVHPQLPEFVQICHEYGVRIFLVTNGVLLKAETAELLLHPAFRQVNFSLHSFPDNYPDRDPTMYLQKIFAYTEMAFAKRPDLYINYRLWNLDDPNSSTSGKNRDFLRRIAEHFQVELPTSVDVRLKKGLKLKNLLYLHFDTEFVWPSLELPVIGQRGRCYGLGNHFGILVDGTVVPCCLDKEADIPLGNIAMTDIEEILTSTRAKAIVQGFKDGKLLENLCQRCQYIERFEPASRQLST